MSLRKNKRQCVHKKINRLIPSSCKSNTDTAIKDQGPSLLVADDKVHNQLFSNKLSNKVIQEVVLSKVAI